MISKEKDFDPAPFANSFPALLALQLWNVIEQIPMPVLTHKQMLWCIDGAIFPNNEQLLITLFQKLQCDKSIWHERVLKIIETNMLFSRKFPIKTLLKLNIISGKDLYALSSSLFFEELFQIHCDI